MEYSLQQLLKTLMDQGASDLHIGIETPPRIRIDGKLLPLQLPPLTPEQTKSLCYSVLTEWQRKELEERREIDLAFSVKNLARFRANIYYERNAIAGAFRLVPFKIYTMNDLGFAKSLFDICMMPRGLVLVTGPTGSGKSTTLAAMIDHINENRLDHIITIEDPIEFMHPQKNCVISQRELGQDTDNYAVALKSILRQDPDVVVIGELRDLETISAALTIAETGHLVFGTIHTNDCISTINRIIDVFPPHQQPQVRAQLSMSLEAVVSQILLPARGGGRILAMEIMRANTAVRALISDGKLSQIYSSMQSGQVGSGMVTMNQSLFDLVRRGLITKELAMTKTSRRDELEEMFLKRGA